ncbi:MAG: DUF948 domain-containing protein [Proteobacteria bacterium]|nr:DUF948 domain-containing protein [Pseudomonadota bacterium]MBU1715220.1 DUF948 domain-containing protein [Pseudomonadota bacterium]
MQPIEFLIVIATFCLTAITSVLIPFLLQIKRTARKAEILITDLNRETPALLKSLADTAEELQRLSSSVNHKIGHTDLIISNVQRSSETLLDTTNMIKTNLIPIIAQIGGFSSGVKAFINFFSSKSDR